MKQIFLALLLLIILLLATGCIPDLPGPIGIPGI
jgi:predicted small lipoprotein YifL